MYKYEDITQDDAFPLLRPTIHHRSTKSTVGFTLVVDSLWHDIWIPKGFDSDGASIPRIFWSITGGPYHPRYIKAAIVHDWLYLTKLVPKEAADTILKQLMCANGSKAWLAEVFQLGVQSPIGNQNFKRDSSDSIYLNEMHALVKLNNPNDYDKFRIADALTLG